MWRSGDQAAFIAAIRALAELRDSLVIIGGWAHRLHQFYPGVVPLANPLYTEDLDCAISRPPPKLTVGIDKRLVDSNFAEHLKGDHEAFTEYHWKGPDSNLKVELLVVQQGMEGKAGLKVGGAVAQRLRYLEIGFIRPWRFAPTRELGFPVEDDEELTVQVVNPAAFLMNKLVTLPRRTKSLKKGKDLLYINDTLTMFADKIETLRVLWAETIDELPASKKKKVNASASAAGALKVEAEMAAQIARTVGRPLIAARVLDACKHGLANLRS